MDYFTTAKQEIPDWLIKTAFLEEVETTVRLGLRALSGEGVRQTCGLQAGSCRVPPVWCEQNGGDLRSVLRSCRAALGARAPGTGWGSWDSLGADAGPQSGLGGHGAGLEGEGVWLQGGGGAHPLSWHGGYGAECGGRGGVVG
uniref:Uncharacterized protein n=1 Tax=Rangifer tarandus platyrhynchus TaxID=3082113 RepID=A0ACB0FM75_RANTA|nr:unnamed protein product [Rangifer tarandus platyrhynchus]